MTKYLKSKLRVVMILTLFGVIQQLVISQVGLENWLYFFHGIVVCFIIDWIDEQRRTLTVKDLLAAIDRVKQQKE